VCDALFYNIAGYRQRREGYAGGFRECDVGVLEYSDRTRETDRDSRNEASERGCLYNVRALIRFPSSQFQGEANRAKADEQLWSAETTPRQELLASTHHPESGCVPPV
jgi:hypothetical protein